MDRLAELVESGNLPADSKAPDPRVEKDLRTTEYVAAAAKAALAGRSIEEAATDLRAMGAGRTATAILAGKMPLLVKKGFLTGAAFCALFGLALLAMTVWVWAPTEDSTADAVMGYIYSLVMLGGALFFGLQAAKYRSVTGLSRAWLAYLSKSNDK